MPGLAAVNRPAWLSSRIGICTAATIATLLVLATKWLAEAAGIERELFGFATGNDETTFAAVSVRATIYPAFANLVHVIGVQGVIAVQTWFYFAAGLALFARLAEYLPTGGSARRLVGLAAVAALLNPRVFEYPLSISQEGLFIPALLALMTAVVEYLGRPRLATAALAGALTGLSVGIREIGVAFLPMVVVALLVPVASRVKPHAAWRSAALSVFAASAGFAAMAGVERLAYAAMLGDEPRSTVLGINLIAKMPFIVEPGDLSAGATPLERGILERIEANFQRSAAFAASASAATTRWDAREFLTNFIESTFQLRDAELNRAVGDLAQLRGRPVSTTAADLSLTIIRKRPLRFAVRAIGNLGRFLALAEFPTTAGLRDAAAVPQRVSPDVFAGATAQSFQSALRAAGAYHLVAWGPRLAHAAALLGIVAAAAFAAGAALRRRALPLGVALGLAVGCGFLAYFLACAAVINLQVRYVMTVWPMTVVLAALAVLIPVQALAAPRPSAGART